METQRGESECVIEVVTTSGRAASIHFRVGREQVEVWLNRNWFERERCGSIDRGDLRSWLREPGKPLRFGDVALGLDRALDVLGRVVVQVPGVSPRALSPMDRERLVERI